MCVRTSRLFLQVTQSLLGNPFKPIVFDGLAAVELFSLVLTLSRSSKSNKKIKHTIIKRVREMCLIFLFFFFNSGQTNFGENSIFSAFI